jgi:hypothetical protein
MPHEPGPSVALLEEERVRGGPPPRAAGHLFTTSVLYWPYFSGGVSP